MEKICRAYFSSPIGTIEIAGTEKEICSVNFVMKKTSPKSEYSPALKECLRQLDEYFRGKRKIFELQLRVAGTEFQRNVWQALLDVGYGETASYRDIAAAVGKPKAVRAVGNTNRTNPIGIIIPCHRIIGSSGKLVGYGGGLWRKAWLLRHEQEQAASEKKK
jgi:methylated-DNA-[protein]-cysteine S-methyltransferase